MTIGAGLPKFYATFCRLAGREDLIEDPRFSTVPDRVANNDELVALLSEKTRSHPTSWWIEILERKASPAVRLSIMLSR